MRTRSHTQTQAQTQSWKRRGSSASYDKGSSSGDLSDAHASSTSGEDSKATPNDVAVTFDSPFGKRVHSRSFTRSHGSSPPVQQEFPHYMQVHSWDCGLACVSMILARYFGGKLHTTDSLYAKSTAKNESVWTIDLAYLLSGRGFHVTFITLSVGVNEDLGTEQFYAKDFEVDQVRVNDLFARAAENHVAVREESVDTSELAYYLQSGHGCILLLVNKALLRCVNARHPGTNWNRLMSSACCFGDTPCAIRRTSGNTLQKKSTPFVGHFIVLWKYDNRRGLFYYQDPSESQGQCMITSDDLDAARRSFGTDEDTVFVHFTRSP
eukprot:GFYU01002239.1.p1 GENE.GFYU01002239.1~~GFYU01002239.1.p1  ORF type:complete len:323 (+),score=46.00 GFYU01002239.1:169-1137(+)